MKRVLLAVILLGLVGQSAGATVATFDDLSLPGPESYWNGSDGTGYFVSGDGEGMVFYNDYNPDWFCWNGFAYSNMTDTTTSGWTNQYSAYTGCGVHGSEIYGVNYQGDVDYVTTSTLPAVVPGMYVTNTTYAALSMLNGDDFAKKFGGDTGDDEDWFLLSIIGYDENVEVTGTIEFYLADYQFADNDFDYIVDEWSWVNLSGLGEITMLEFSLSSSDMGIYGMNTPAYFALDNLGDIPEPCVLTIGVLSSLAILRRRRA